MLNKNKARLSEEEVEARKKRLYEKYPHFYLEAHRYCEYCTEKCNKFNTLKGILANKQKQVQSLLPRKVDEAFNVQNYKQELKENQEKRLHQRIDLYPICDNCAKRRLYQYEVLGFDTLFDFPEDLKATHKIKHIQETRSTEECQHRKKIECTLREEPVEFCLLSITENKRQELLHYLTLKNDKCSCNSFTLENCGFCNNCKSIVAKKKCPKTMLKFTFSPLDELEQKASN